MLEALKKLKDGNKAGENKADDSRVDEDDLDEDEEEEDEMDGDEVSKIKDTLTQKSAEKWIRGYIKSLHDGLKKIKLSYLIYGKGHTFTRKNYLILLMPIKENT